MSQEDNVTEKLRQQVQEKWDDYIKARDALDNHLVELMDKA